MRLVALDTETTGLDPAVEDVFEVAMIDLDSGLECVVCIEPRPETVAQMHPKAAEVNRYHERISGEEWTWNDPEVALAVIAMHLEGAHIVGAVPDFDTRHLTALFARFGMEPPRWHYHLIDIETLAVGYLHGFHSGWVNRGPRTRHTRQVLPELPWRSDDLSRACGVEPPSEEERHTALGDARWVARWWRQIDRVTRI